MIESSRRRLRIVRVLALATLWTAVAAAASPEGTVPFPGRDQAPLATAESRGFRAAAYPSEDKDHRSDLLLSTPDSDAFERIEVPGIVRSLMFAPGGTLFAVVAKIGKRLPSVTYVLEVDPGTLKGRRRITLPQSAAGMASWGNGRSVLVACRDELRSYTVPEFRSGPLYRLLGANSSLANVPGTERFVVGRDDGLVLVDLSDPHGVDEIPVRDRIETAAPVLQVRLGAEEGTALAVLADGSTRAVSLDFGSPPARPATPDPALAAQRTLEPKGLADPPVEPQPEPAATPASPTPAVPEDRAAPEPVPAPSRTTPRSIPDAPETATPEAAPEAAGGPQGTPEPGLPPEPPPVPDEGGSTWGSLTGARRDAIAWVVLYGPDNVLNEALRVRPGTNGLWKAEGLAPGRYRVVLDAGPDRIAVVRPAFQVLTVRENEVTRAESFEVSGVR